VSSAENQQHALNRDRIIITHLGYQTAFYYRKPSISQRLLNFGNPLFDMLYFMYRKATVQNLVAKKWVEGSEIASVVVANEPLHRIPQSHIRHIVHPTSTIIFPIPCPPAKELLLLSINLSLSNANVVHVVSLDIIVEAARLTDTKENAG
jgi:hypothetical protein